jgi:hypothetical protein
MVQVSVVQGLWSLQSLSIVQAGEPLDELLREDELLPEDELPPEDKLPEDAPPPDAVDPPLSKSPRIREHAPVVMAASSVVTMMAWTRIRTSPLRRRNRALPPGPSTPLAPAWPWVR